MSENKYSVTLSIIQNDIEKTIESFYMYLEINEIARENPEVLKQMNINPNFWTAIVRGLQDYFIITLGRIFDEGKDSHSIILLFRKTIAHPEYFSKTALADRKRKLVGGPDPEWLAEFIEKAWQPSRNDLVDFCAELDPIKLKYAKSIGLIRNKIVAHRDIMNRERLEKIMQSGVFSEIEDMMEKLLNLISRLYQIFYNGERPNSVISINKRKDEAKNSVRGALNIIFIENK